MVIGDPSKRSVWPLIQLLESFYVHTAPLRLGLIMAVNATATGYEDAGVALLNAYNYVAEVKDPYQGLSFITDVSINIYCLSIKWMSHLKRIIYYSYQIFCSITTYFL